MDIPKPYELNEAEWRGIVQLPAIQEAWGLESGEDWENFASTVYAAKFRFHSGGPGYVGDIFIIQGDAISDHAPILLRRDAKGHLIVAE
jgi:hypothetical protein